MRRTRSPSLSPAIGLSSSSAGFDASVPEVDHTVLGEAADKSGDVQDVALRRVVGVPDDRFVVVRRRGGGSPCARLRGCHER